MGCDGGVIATQRRFTRIKVVRAREEPDREEVQKVQWTTCALSAQPFKEPIVMCELGYIFNKEAIMEALLSKQLKESKFSHIRRLRDVSELHFEVNPHHSRASSAGNDTSEIAHYICPLSKQEVKGPYKFAALWTCGCVFSARALREVGTESKECQKCGKPFDPAADIITLNGSEDEIDELKRRMEMKRLLEADKKKEKKKSKGKGKKPVEEGDSSGAILSIADPVSEGKKPDYRMVDIKRLDQDKDKDLSRKRPLSKEAVGHRDKRPAASSDVSAPFPMHVSDAKFEPGEEVRGSIFVLGKEKNKGKYGYNVLTR